MYLSVLSICLLCIIKSECTNILFTNALPSPSHFIWDKGLIALLNQRGYNVTFIAPGLSKENETELYHPIDCPGLELNFDTEAFSKYSLLERLKFYFLYAQPTCQIIYDSTNFNNILNNPGNTFDVIILDITIIQCFLPLIQIYNATTVIGVVPFMLPSEFSHMFGNNLQPAYLPHYLYSSSDSMTFYERLCNTFYTYGTEILMWYYKFDYQKQLQDKFGNNLEPLETLSRRISLLLANIHPVFDYPQPLPPNIIPVGGLHVKPPKKLPDDFAKIMTSAKNGVIIFSLGTNVRPEKMTAETIKVYTDTFTKLNQTVIWKYGGNINNLPENVFVKKWLPQNDLMAHPKTHLFIGHGGALSTQEAYSYGVPMVLIPFYLDQHFTSKTVALRKMGIQLNFKELTSKNFMDAIKEVLYNPIYRRNVEQTSKRFQDLPMSPQELSIKWIEYAMKHNGTSFLDLKSRDMSYLVYTSLDVALFVLVLVMLITSIIIYFMKLILHMTFKDSKTKTE